MTVVFRVAASPRIGFGHLVRAIHLARALGVAPRVSIRGGEAARATARRLGGTPLAGRVTAIVRPGLGLLVIDDPSRTAALAWLRAARRAGVRVASFHDVGIAPLASDLAIDGSLGARRVPGLGAAPASCRLGPAYAVLAPEVGRLRRQARVARAPASLVIGLGGGQQARAGLAIAEHLLRGLGARSTPARVRVLLSLGLRSVERSASKTVPVATIGPRQFRAALARATVAVVAGGTTLYEACALGTPVVAVPVVPGQATTVRRFVRAGLAVPAAASGGGVGSAGWGRAAAEAALDLLGDVGRQRALARAGRRTIDGRGAARVAQAIVRLDRGRR